jgi:hypothetical protein
VILLKLCNDFRTAFLEKEKPETDVSGFQTGCDELLEGG